MLSYIIVKSGLVPPIKFTLYRKEAPDTCKNFLKNLPLKRKFVHAKISGEEIWTFGPKIKVKQENASARLKPGEIGYASPLNRSDISKAIAIVYGRAILWDCVNVFARADGSNLRNLKRLAKIIEKKSATLEIVVEK